MATRARELSWASSAFLTPPAPGTADWPMTLSVSRSERPVLVLVLDEQAAHAHRNMTVAQRVIGGLGEEDSYAI